jgi:hypothetical protein
MSSPGCDTQVPEATDTRADSSLSYFHLLYPLLFSYHSSRFSHSFCLNAEGKFTLDDLQHASKNIAQAELRNEAGKGKRLEQVVAHWAGAPPKADQFKCVCC